MSSEKSLKEYQEDILKAYLSVFGQISIKQVIDEIVEKVFEMSVNRNRIIFKELSSDVICLTILLLSLLGEKSIDKYVGSDRVKSGRARGKKYAIYKLESPSGKLYIGQTTNFFKRMRDYKHLRGTHRQPKIYNAIKKYGFENFIKSIIELCDTPEDLDRREEYLIRTLDTTNRGYNIRTGGHSSRHSESTRKKQSENNWLRIKGASKEYRETMSKACRGEKNGFYGKHHTDELKKHYHDLFCGKKMPKEVCERMSKSHIGLKHSKEAVAKSSKIAAKCLYIVTDDKGKCLIVPNMTQFSKDRNVKASGLLRVSNQPEKSYKGLKVRKIFDGSKGDKLNVGLFLGAFDPITNGHTALIEHLIKSEAFSQIWVSPCYKHMYGKTMADPKHRLAMCATALQGIENVYVFSHEIDIKHEGSTYDLIKLLQDEYRYCRFSVVIGLDNANTFDKWVNYRDLERMVQFVVVPRAGEVRDPKVTWYTKPPHALVNVEPGIIPELSSTTVRKNLETMYHRDSNGVAAYRDLKKQLHPAVLTYINNRDLYKDTKGKTR